MILIADCGSTKINWTLLNGKEKVAQIFTTGMNALLLTEEEMKEQIKRELMPHLTNYKVDEIYYYGAGKNADILGGDEPVGIDQFNTVSESMPVGIYSLSGTRLPAPQRGVNIVKMADGRVLKVLVK